MKILIYLTVLVFFFSCHPTKGQVRKSENMLSFKLSDNTKIDLAQKSYLGSDFSPYYYIPRSLRISKNNGISEFSFLTYLNDNDEIDGGLMHVLLTWGLDGKQEDELQRALFSRLDSTAVLMGGITLIPFDGGGFKIVGNTNLAKILRNSLKSKGMAPSMPSGKLALSFLFSSEDAKVISQAMDNTEKWEGISFQIRYHEVDGRKTLGKVVVVEGDFKNWMENIKR